MRCSLPALAVLSGALAGCSGEPCKSEPPAVRAEVRILDQALRSRATSMEVVLRAGDARYARTFDFFETLSDGTTSFSVVIEPPPASPSFDIELSVSAYAASGGRGELVAEGRSVIEGSRDACNVVTVELGDAGVLDGGPGDGGLPDIGPKPDGGLEPILSIDPGEIDLSWIDRGTVFDLTAALTYSGSIEELTATTTVTWAVPSLSEGTLAVRIDTVPLAVGAYAGAVTVQSSDPMFEPVRLSIRFRAFQPIHVGPAADTCPHPSASGATITACDFEGQGAVESAEASIVPYSHLVLHDDAGARAYYTMGTTGIVMPESSWISAAPGVDPANTVLACRSGDGLRLRGDGARVERLTIASEGSCSRVINTWSGSTPEDGTGGHVIDRVILFAVRPEIFGSNSIDEVVGLSEETIFSNSYVYGWWEELGEFEFAHGTKLLSNTIVFYSTGEAIDIDGTRGLTFANNVVVSLPRSTQPLLEGDPATRELTVTGNIVEGFGPIVAGLDDLETTNRIEDNREGEAELDSPREPRFLADASATTGSITPGIGVSLDGVSVEGRTDFLPGAFQMRSLRPGPRRMLVRLGPPSCASCDVSSDADNEVQVAAFSSWRGGVVEIEPGTYAGNAVIGWETTIRGTGSDPSQVVLISDEEDALLETARMWSHESVITVLEENRDGFLIENLTVRVDADTIADESGILVESPPASPPLGPLVVRNVVVDAINTGGGGLYHPLFVGEGALVQDVIVHGAFETCVRVAGDFPRDYQPPSVGASIVNLTCRLTDPVTHRPRAAFELANATDVLFMNIVVESATTAPLFAPQRRTAGDTGTAALDPPVSFAAHDVSWRGLAGTFGGFSAADGSYVLEDLEEVALGTPLFVSPTDHHLAPGCPAIDSGGDPSLLDPSLVPGTSIDGVSRAGRLIDRGAHEQGN